MDGLQLKMKMDVEENDGRLAIVPLGDKSTFDGKTESADENSTEAELIIIPEEHIPIENEVSIKDDLYVDCDAGHPSVPGDKKVNDIFDEIGYSSFENPLHIESDKLYLLHDGDIDLAGRVGLIRRSQVDRTPVIPDRKAMRVLLRHIYDVTGDVYDDIPAKYRTSHVSLAFYLKLCIRCPGQRLTSETQRQVQV
ncbi:uncharacterized protein LOC117339862 [Pecten maximus]|uniref:uncharacterized protein LOC117339862 n=1 Tax=Pecten maximus TaxID=6579 RepID=UPI001457FEB4|nr:uncharacterized protein LOC117339862 [Pecten maximus]